MINDIQIQEKITGEQIENILDLIHECNLFEDFFGEQEEVLNAKETMVLVELFGKQESNKKYEPTEQEQELMLKFSKGVSKSREKMIKHITNPKNKEVIKKIYNILKPNEIWDIRKATKEVAERLPSIKSEIGIGF